MFTHNVRRVANRIVSLHRPHTRPIVRGKEIKKVEFGPKVHMLQVDGISIIHYVANQAFNEGTLVKSAILHHKNLLSTPCKQLSADAIYATNANRKYLAEKGIFHGFVNKGRKTKDKAVKVLKAQINKARATQLEGAFGQHKQFFKLGRIKTKTERTEQLSIYLG